MREILPAVALLVLAFSCNQATDPPPPGEQPLTFEALDASCTEVWMEVKFHPAAQPRTIEIRRDTLPILTTTLTGTDTLIVDEGLLPNSEYTYTLTRPGAPFGQALTTTITTMDTTSGNWVFDPPVLLGDGSSSVLYDVAIINDTLAYAVGEIYRRDSLGNWDPQPYNLARWDGSSWNLQKVPYYHQGQPFYSPIRAVFAFNANDIWFGIGNLIHWNGQGFISVALPPGVWGPYRINKVWGHDGEIWIVGDGGSIAHRNVSGTWRRVETGTQLSVYDVFGSTNPMTGETEVLAIASNVFQNQGAKLLRIEGGGAVEMPGSGLTWGVKALWFSAGKRYYVVGPGIHQKRGLQDSLWSVYPPGQVTSYFSAAVRGIDVNDLFVAGSFREVVHFNGVSWRKYFGLMPGTSGGFGSILVQGNLVVAVGSQSPRALVAIGRRN
jgi:hypothetical protein